MVERAIHWLVRGSAPDLQAHWRGGSGVRVRGNAGQLQQVLMNLMQNACDAARGAGRAPQVWLALDCTPAWATLRLRDNGPGIAAEHLSHVFEPFFSTKPVGQGTGLGLSISYGIVERCGGRLLAANHPQGGAEFSLVLPRCAAGEPAAPLES